MTSQEYEDRIKLLEEGMVDVVLKLNKLADAQIQDLLTEITGYRNSLASIALIGAHASGNDCARIAQEALNNGQ